uniref:Uncharacterized protein n=1 Tax=Molossus molossus TaxID=27622 RepID=A0A7J8HDG5_MOLMO|nr:hypothetical protein HJG59_011099 [Molossus molossus]
MGHMGRRRHQGLLWHASSGTLLLGACPCSEATLGWCCWPRHYPRGDLSYAGCLCVPHEQMAMMERIQRSHDCPQLFLGRAPGHALSIFLRWASRGLSRAAARRPVCGEPGHGAHASALVEEEIRQSNGRLQYGQGNNDPLL